MTPPAPLYHHDFAAGLAGWQAAGSTARLDRWLDRPALLLGDGIPFLAPVDLEAPYSLRARLSAGPAECYVGVCFHMADAKNGETIYLAPHCTGQRDALQYDPIINGSNTWQIFGDADGLTDEPLQLERGRWHTLRVDVWPGIAQVHLDDRPAPVATFPLRGGLRRGRVGLWAGFPAYAADFAILPLQHPAPSRPAVKAPPPDGFVREWLVAEASGPGSLTGPAQFLATEHNGSLCLNRLFSGPTGSRARVAFSFEVPAGQSQATLETGYSDSARIWCDGRLVHTGDWRWAPAERADGRVRLGQVRADLDVAPGTHDITMEIATTEPPFGWGAAARVMANGRPCATQPALPRALAITR